MRYATICKILGAFIMMFSFSMLPEVGIAIWYEDGGLQAFIASFSITFVTGALFWFPVRKITSELKVRDGFLVVTIFWTVLSIFGALPLMLAKHPHLNFTNALFESTSGLTTTGASVIPGIDYLPHAIKFYRQFLQFLGGMGIVVLAVAILPMLGVGGLQLYQAEAPGPAKDTKLTPRITETAKALWYIYVGLTVCCAFFYWLAGMSPFDAIGESFSTISTGGFATHDSSFAFYNSPAIEVIGSVFMVLSGVNFSLHFIALRNKSLLGYWQDDEFRAYIAIMFIACFVTLFVLLHHHTYTQKSTAIIKSIFNVISLSTTTGLTSASLQSWPSFVPIMIMVAAMIGGCASSTTGGIKVIRIILLWKQGTREILRLIHPKAVLSIKFGDRFMSDNLMQVIWGFFAVYIMIFVIAILILLATGINLETAFGALVASLANSGVGLGDAASNFSELNDVSKLTLSFAMLVGRLEIFTVLVLFTPAFWRA